MLPPTIFDEATALRVRMAVDLVTVLWAVCMLIVLFAPRIERGAARVWRWVRRHGTHDGRHMAQRLEACR